MTLTFIIAVLFGGGILAGFAERLRDGLSRWVTLLALALAGLLTVTLIVGQPMSLEESFGDNHQWLCFENVSWIPRFGIQYLLAADGISVVLIGLTVFLGFIALFSAWEEIKERRGFFYFNFLWTLAGVVGIFVALDLFLFFVFWEVMLIPMFFIIVIWGHEDRYYAAIKFFIYTQASSLLMLLSMLGLVFAHWQQTQELSFSYFDLLGTNTSGTFGLLLMLGFFVAFLVKLPGVPVHNWLPDAHTQAPTPGSVILAGILLKTGAYGLLRFVIPLFPEAAQTFTPFAMTLGVVSILYAAKMAFAQNDIKRLIAYSSISHMGFITIGIFSWNAIALQGTVLQMLAHGLSSAGLFAMAGALQHRLHTRAMDQMGGLWSQAPKLAAIAMFFAIAALGLPGLGNFVGEFLVLLGTFQAYPIAAVVAALGMVVAPIYALILLQKSFFGGPSAKLLESKSVVADFQGRELLMMALLMVALIIMGFFPRLVSTLADPALINLQALGW